MPFSLLMFLKEKVVAYLFLIVSLRIPTRFIRDYSAFTVHSNFTVSPSARCVSAANAVCRSIAIFKKDCILLTDISQLLNQNNCSLFLCPLSFLMVF
jgi:hypothetical protein